MAKQTRSGVRFALSALVLLAAAVWLVMRAHREWPGVMMPVSSKPVAGYDRQRADLRPVQTENIEPSAVLPATAGDTGGVEPEPEGVPGTDNTLPASEAPAGQLPAVPPAVHEAIREATDKNPANTHVENRPDGTVVRHIDAGHKSVMAAVVGPDGKLVVRHGEDFPEQAQKQP